MIEEMVKELFRKIEGLDKIEITEHNVCIHIYAQEYFGEGATLEEALLNARWNYEETK